MILWNRLPEQMPMHWNFRGEIDSYSSKAFAVLFSGGFLCVMHLICILAVRIDPRHENISPRVFRLILWSVPAVALLISLLIYPAALNYHPDVNLWTGLFMGILFMIIGNYLPKCRYNYTVGIRIPWTLADEEVWNRTHRMAGPLWMLCGAAVIVSGLITGGNLLVILILTVIMVLIPTVYAILLYRRKHTE